MRRFDVSEPVYEEFDLDEARNCPMRMRPIRWATTHPREVRVRASYPGCVIVDTIHRVRTPDELFSELTPGWSAIKVTQADADWE